MKLVITIDTEEDNWGDYSCKGHTLKNIERIPELQQLFNDFNVRPTYLINYPVAADKMAISIFKKILKENKCEIGTHCHPWNTPPFEEEKTEYNSMLCNLPSDLQFRKLKYLHDTINNNLDVVPVSFRAGRWGYNQNVAKNLHKLGYKIDTSVTPFTDWREYHGPEFINLSPRPFRFSSEDIFHESEGGEMLEVPVTVGFLQRNFKLCNRILQLTGQRPINYLRITGVLYKLNIVNKVWLSPEGFDSKSMIRLAKSMMRNNFGIINMMFHSPALIHSLSPYVRTKDDEKKFIDRIREFLRFTNDAGIESIMLSESLQEYSNKG